jgi:membrane protease YdiL (CAAX protease family)
MIYGYVPTIMIQPITVWVAIINTFILPITIVFAEMPLYFGYSLNRMEAQTGNKYFAIAYTMFFYALQHSFIPLLFDTQYIAYRFLSFLPLMIVLGIIYNKKRSLSTLMIGHGVLDLATGVQILISSLWPAVFEMMQHSN